MSLSLDTNLIISPSDGKESISVGHTCGRYWLALYAVALVLCPPIHVREKTLYAAEVLLLAPVLLAFWEILKGRFVRPPKELVVVWAALSIAYIFGNFRGMAAYEIALHKDLNDIVHERFSWTQDGIRWVRWSVMAGSPWIFLQLHRYMEAGPRSLDLFVQWLKWSILVSSVISILVWVGLLDLSSIYVIRAKGWWIGRSFGTFASPLEAGLVYGLAPVLVLCSPATRSTLGRLADATLVTVSLLSLTITFSVSAWISLFAAAAYFTAKSFTPQRKLVAVTSICLAVLFGGTAALLFVPETYYISKIVSMSARAQIWTSWLNGLPSRPWSALTGIGFADVSVDNSSIMLLIYGGIGLFVALYFWLRVLLRGAAPIVSTAFLFWLVSWCTLDSIGYWGIGRILWMMLALGSGLVLLRASATDKISGRV